MNDNKDNFAFAERPFRSEHIPASDFAGPDTLFRHLADNAPLILRCTDPNGTCSYLNLHWYAFTGQTPETALGFGWLEAIHPEERAIFQALFLAANRVPEALRHHYRLRRHDGEYRWVIDTVQPYFNEKGEYMGFLGSVIDVTDHKRIEEDLQKAREQAEQTTERIARLQKVTAALSETLSPAQVADVLVEQGAPALGAIAGSVLLLTPDSKMLELVRSGAPDIVTRPFLRFSTSLQVPAADSIRLGEPVWIESQQAYLERYPHLSKEILTWGHQAAVAVPMIVKQRPVGVLTLSFDKPLEFSPEDQEYALTLAQQGAQALQRAYAEETLRLSEERFRILSNAVPSIVWTATPEGQLSYFNAHGVWYTGQASETLARYGVELILHPKDHARYTQAWTHALTSVPDEFLIEVRYRRHDGEYRWFQTRAIPIYGSARKVKIWYGVTTDIHDRVVVEQVLRAKEKQLHQLNRTLEQKVQEQTRAVRTLAADLAKAEQRERHRIAQILHDDLQQRLYAIQIQIDLLQMQLDGTSPSLKEEINEINIQMKETMTLTRHLSVDLSPPILRDEGLAHALRWLAAQMEEQYGLQITLHASEPFALPDQDLQVLLFNCVRELLFNIVKHAGVNQAQVVMQRFHNELRIEVQDKGKGFQMPTSPDISSASSFGLPTLRHRMTLFGGRLDISSSPGAGTQVRVTMPVFTDGKGPTSSS